MKWVEILIAILSGLVVCIPLVVNLVESVREATQERNWATLMHMVMEYMCEAEKAFSTGENRKAFVMAHLSAIAKAANYDLTSEAREKISRMIDAMCDMAHIVNGGGESDDC